MAKLDNVKAVAEKAELNGVTYVKTEGYEKPGDIIRVDKTSGRGASNGDYFAVRAYSNVDDEAVFDDADGCVRWRAHIGETTLFRKLLRQAVNTTVTEVKRHARVGERIRIVNTQDRRWSNGEEFVVSKDAGDGDVFIKHPKGNGNGNACVHRSEYVVLDNVEAAPIPTPTPRLKVGEYAKVIETLNIHGGVRSDVIIGEIYEIIKDEGGRIPFRGKRVGDGFITWFRESALERATDAEGDAKRVYKIGEYVKVTKKGGAHNYDVGEIVKVTKSYGEPLFGGIKASTGTEGNCLASEQVEPATEADYESVRAETERKKAEDECERKWAAIGRKVNEYKAGDIVRFTSYKGVHGLNDYNGILTEVAHAEADGYTDLAKPPYVKCGFGTYTNPRHIELVTPVEQRFDR